MKALILTCSTGGGHNACAEALRDAFPGPREDCHIASALDFVSKNLCTFLTWGHTTMYRYFPGLFRWGYHHAETHPELLQEDAFLYRLLTDGTGALSKFLAEGQYNTVICTHIFAGLLLRRTLREYPMDIRTGFVSTDYTCSPGAANTEPDLCFLPAASLIPEFTRRGFPEETLRVSGMPVREAFYHIPDKHAMKTELGISPEDTHLLIMCGSMGCGPLKKLTKYLVQNSGHNCRVTVVCGTNERLRRALEKRYRSDPRINILGYVSDIPKWMDSADLLLTKPGGLSVSEAAAKGLPMVLMDTVGGCEEHNLRYFTLLGGAVTAETPEELAWLCVRLLDQPEKRKRMETALRSRYRGNAGKNIWTAFEKERLSEKIRI